MLQLAADASRGPSASAAQSQEAALVYLLDVVEQQSQQIRLLMARVTPLSATERLAPSLGKLECSRQTDVTDIVSQPGTNRVSNMLRGVLPGVQTPARPSIVSSQPMTSALGQPTATAFRPASAVSEQPVGEEPEPRGLVGLTAEAAPGDTLVHVDKDDEFPIGTIIKFVGQYTNEINQVVGKGSLRLRFPTKGRYPSGTLIVGYDPANPSAPVLGGHPSMPSMPGGGPPGAGRLSMWDLAENPGTRQPTAYLAQVEDELKHYKFQRPITMQAVIEFTRSIAQQIQRNADVPIRPWPTYMSTGVQSDLIAHQRVHRVLPAGRTYEVYGMLACT